jgi:hypothetical protein
MEAVVAIQRCSHQGLETLVSSGHSAAKVVLELPKDVSASFVDCSIIHLKSMLGVQVPQHV